MLLNVSVKIMNLHFKDIPTLRSFLKDLNFIFYIYNFTFILYFLFLIL